ncbi:MAG: HAD-IIIA family hydrolase [Sphingobacteriales bacterium]|uniref:D-glycero-alpha-D-manno-heptose-1,7-bisphosphate 7-phosphatase n=1 Tax=Hydrotalea flava TaxID=714549 RepID=UPI00083792A1|nr:HAD-IIIA family hydrolase [Hydrotalea flava]RTL53178.1 MAG: HAD-IIIA family hydrolase [Sphingobacteriales bacterium]
MNNLPDINQEWTLFLDRDGVINAEKKEDYVLSWQEFHFLPGVKESLALLNPLFKRIVVVTNQKCIGKGLLTVDGLHTIHTNMLREIQERGGRIDKIYFCPDLSDDSPNRKPAPGMAFQAKEDFSDIDFSKSIMIGNKLSDMAFGKNTGMYTIFVATTNPEIPFPHPLVDARFDDLYHATKALTKA